MPRHATPSDRAAVLLTRRSTLLRSHAGQWALPGGRIDGNETPEAAALRELAEEVGLDVDAACVLGRLDDFTTRSGFVITPVVVWAGAGAALVPNAAEVASVHRIPVDELLRADAPMLEKLPEHDHPVLRMPVGTSWIAAPTAALLYQFRELCLLGRATRVAHFEQPLFAWR
jgi:8-oxo-dGTP pyrophosphatase MutT (NUDIX family)